VLPYLQGRSTSQIVHTATERAAQALEPATRATQSDHHEEISG
jgi:hypothetical protein